MFILHVLFQNATSGQRDRKAVLETTHIVEVDLNIVIKGEIQLNLHPKLRLQHMIKYHWRLSNSHTCLWSCKEYGNDLLSRRKVG